jgi:hypothetical protein
MEDRIMEYSVTMSESKKYVMIRVMVPVTRDIALRFTRDAKAMAEMGGTRIDRFLFDMSKAHNIAGVGSNYDFAYSDMAKLEVDRSARSAVLVGPTDSTHDFPELVLRNAGYNVRVFTNEEEAVAWLLQTNAAPDTPPIGR